MRTISALGWKALSFSYPKRRKIETNWTTYHSWFTTSVPLTLERHLAPTYLSKFISLKNKEIVKYKFDQTGMKSNLIDLRRVIYEFYYLIVYYWPLFSITDVFRRFSLNSYFLNLKVLLANDFAEWLEAVFCRASFALDIIICGSLINSSKDVKISIREYQNIQS